jgi:hypothetical protein
MFMIVYAAASTRRQGDEKPTTTADAKLPRRAAFRNQPWGYNTPATVASQNSHHPCQKLLFSFIFHVKYKNQVGRNFHVPPIVMRPLA